MFFDRLHAESMRSAIERMLTDPGAAKNLAMNALESARQRFQPRVIAQRHLSIYQEVLQKEVRREDHKVSAVVT